MKLVNQSTLTSKITLPDGSTEDVTTLSNQSSTEQMTTSFTKVKEANKTSAKPGDEIEYTITLTNDSDYSVTDMSIKDTISSDATYVAGSVTIDGASYPDYDPATGFDLSDLESSGSTVIKYKATVIASPVGNVVTNTAEVTYSVNEVTGLVESTNEVSVSLLNNKITLTKTSDKSAVISGQTLTYQITIANNGNLKNTNLMFTDPLPSGVTFVEGSVTVDETSMPSADPVTGFALSDLEAGASTTVKFNVTVD